MNNITKKNHFVPEFYLRRWTDPDGKLFAYRTLVEHKNVHTWKHLHVSAIGYQTHLYTQIVEGQESDELEKWFNREFESPAKPALDKVFSNKKLSSRDWRILIDFIAAQDVRTPTRLLEHMHRYSEILPSALDDAVDRLETLLREGRTEELKAKRQLNDSESFPLKIETHIEEGAEIGTLKAESYAGRSTWIHAIKHLLNNTLKVLHDHHWSIVRPAKGLHWPTSDNPVVKLNWYGPDNYDFKGGWSVKKGNIIFPIGPEHAMFVEMGDKPAPGRNRLSVSQTNQFIKIITEHAYRVIFSQTQNDNIPALRQRIVDPERLAEEKEETARWHEANARMERDYLLSNRERKET